MKVLSVIAILLLASFAAAAEDPYSAAAATLSAAAASPRPAAPARSLDDLEQQAMQGNPEVRVAVRRVAVAEAGLPAAGALDDPMFQYRDWGTPLARPWDLNQAQNMFMVSQNFAGPGKRALRSEIAGKDIELAKSQLEAVRRDVRARVRRSFYDLLRNRDELRIHDEQVSIARQALATARIKYTVGRVPQADVLKAQIALTRLVEHLNGLEEDGAMARATLNTLIGADPAAPIEVAGEYTTPAQLPPVMQLEQLAVDSRPELAGLKTMIAQSDARTRLARKAYTPDFNVGLGDMVMPEGSTFRNNYMAEFSLTLPWLNRRKHDSEISQAQATQSEQLAEYDNQRAAVFLEIQEALIKARTAQRNLALYRDTLRPQAEATLKATAAAYQNDRADFLTLLDAQNAIVEVQSSYFKAAAEFEARLADLERAVGAPIAREQAARPAEVDHE